MQCSSFIASNPPPPSKPLSCPAPIIAPTHHPITSRLSPPKMRTYGYVITSSIPETPHPVAPRPIAICHTLEKAKEELMRAAHRLRDEARMAGLIYELEVREIIEVEETDREPGQLLMVTVTQAYETRVVGGYETRVMSGYRQIGWMCIQPALMVDRCPEESGGAEGQRRGAEGSRGGAEDPRRGAESQRRGAEGRRVRFEGQGGGDEGRRDGGDGQSGRAGYTYG
ncbi:hypothetical protein N0V83_009934 [Neocucurbitaria cava]|uniref:Uncharacterized protein n=1 Tax=Neocucurbitaria cava TaxID=798079 RepID=A0A9W8Y2C3_9PLEO|nr:hypothetical protein N0V83_009934 [Neocucurbitaria cava]